MGFKGKTINTQPEQPAHILAEDDAAIYQSIFGEDGVFNIGGKFKTTVLSNNKVRVGDGVLNIAGHVGRTDYGDYDDLTIENGVSGQKRNDIIFAKFTTTGAGGIDTLALGVKKGTSGTTPTDPAMTKGDIYAGSKLRELPLWRVKIEGLSIVKVEQMFTVNPTNKELEDKYNELNNNLTPVSLQGNDDAALYIQSFYEVGSFELVRVGHLVTFNISVNIKSGTTFITNNLYTITKQPIPTAFRPRRPINLLAYGCGNNWENTVACTGLANEKGEIQLLTPKLSAFYKMSGTWYVE